LAKLEKAFEPVESDINAVLLADGRIKEGQTFRDLPEDSIRKLSQKPDLLLSKIPKPVNVEVVA